jgi:hypothetical protein
MKNMSTLLVPTVIWSLLACACVSEGDDLYEADTIAAQNDDQANDDGKADSASAKARLDRSTAAEVATTFTKTFHAELDACFAAYRSKIDGTATSISSAVAATFTRLSNDGCNNSYEVAEVSRGVLAKLGQSAATVGEVKAAVNAWALPQLKASTVNGFVSVEKAALTFYDAVIATQTANAVAREKDPAGVNLDEIRATWNDITRSSNLDSAYLNPVQLTPAQVNGSSTTLFRALRKQFPLKTAVLLETGNNATTAFHGVSEGLNDDPDFAPIQTALAKRSITKRFFFAGGGDEWSTHVLIVIDQHNQAWGFQMGYSE